MATQTTTTTTAPWAGQEPYLRYGFEAAKNLLQRGMPNYYPGQTLAGPDPRMLGAWNATTGYVTGPRAQAQQMAAEQALGGSYNTGAAYQNYGLGMMGPQSQAQFAGMTPFSQDQYGDLLAGNVNTAHLSPVIDAMGYDIRKAFEPQMAALRDQGPAYQRGGGSRGDLQNERVMNELSGQLTRAAAPMYSQAYQQAQQMRMPAAQMGIGQHQFGLGAGLQGAQTAQRAVGLYPGTMQAPLSMYNALGNVGQQARSLQQEYINRDIEKYNYEMMRPQTALQNYLGAITGNYGGQSQTVMPGPSGLSTIGKFAQIAGSLAPFFIGSDVRLKKNIKQIGNYKGLGVYSFEYLWNDEPQVGVMAQEVERVNPDAVIEVGGYKMVNYGAL